MPCFALDPFSHLALDQRLASLYPSIAPIPLSEIDSLTLTLALTLSRLLRANLTL
jgi:hypothetical protein